MQLFQIRKKKIREKAKQLWFLSTFSSLLTKYDIICIRSVRQEKNNKEMCSKYGLKHAKMSVLNSLQKYKIIKYSKFNPFTKLHRPKKTKKIFFAISLPIALKTHTF